MAIHRLEIPDWLPSSINDLMRMHFHARNRLLKGEAELVAVYFLLAKIPQAEGKRRVTLTFAAPGVGGGRGAKVGDVDNRLKGLLDSLVKCGGLVDDAPAWMELGEIRAERGLKRTTIVLEDLEGDRE